MSRNQNNVAEKRIKRVLCSGRVTVENYSEELDRNGRSDLVYYAKIKEINQEDRGSKKQGNVASKGGTHAH